VILPVSKDSNQKVRLDSFVVSPEIVLGRIVGLVLTQACEVSKRRRKRLRKFVIVELHISCVPLSNERREGMQSGIEQNLANGLEQSNVLNWLIRSNISGIIPDIWLFPKYNNSITASNDKAFIL
jgi:hypothetical protein